jgi:hypothetical protein
MRLENVNATVQAYVIAEFLYFYQRHIIPTQPPEDPLPVAKRMHFGGNTHHHFRENQDVIHPELMTKIVIKIINTQLNLVGVFNFEQTFLLLKVKVCLVMEKHLTATTKIVEGLVQLQQGERPASVDIMTENDKFHAANALFAMKRREAASAEDTA